MTTDLHLQRVQLGHILNEIRPPAQGRHDEGHDHKDGEGGVSVKLVGLENEEHQGCHLASEPDDVHDPSEDLVEGGLFAEFHPRGLPEAEHVLDEPEQGWEGGDVHQEEAAHQRVVTREYDVQQDHQGGGVHRLHHQALHTHTHTHIHTHTHTHTSHIYISQPDFLV